MLNITKLAIVKNRVMIMAIILVTILGILSYQKLPKAEDPGFVVRKARVVTYFPGASPQRIEQLVTDKIEKAIQEMPELEFVTSESRSGVSVITVKIWDRYKNMRPIWDTLRRKVERTKAILPNGVVGPIVNDEFGDVFGTILTVTGDGLSYKDLKDVAVKVRDELLYLPEVGKVDFFGEQEERIFIEYNDSILSELGVSSLQIKEVLEGRNIVIPGGSIATDRERIILEPSGNFDSIDDIANAVIKLPGRDEVLYLNDIATVSRGYIDPSTNLFSYTGNPSIALAISLRENGNISKLGTEVKDTVEKLQNVFPIGVEFNYLVLESEEVTKRVNTFLMNLVQSVGLVMIIMLLSLGGRMGWIVASLIPMTILMSFIFMSFLSIQIDQTSLAALIIALGMLVDNAIVMCELNYTHMTKGMSAFDAALQSAHELKTSLLTSSLTTSAAFLPIFLANSKAGEYTASLFKVVTIALLSSWILSLTMIPMLCVLFLKVGKKVRKTDTGVFRWYRAALAQKLKHPYRQVAIFCLILFASLSCFAFIPKTFFPPSERPLFTVKYELPVGTKIERTTEVVKGIEEFLVNNLKDEGIVNWATFIGGVTPRYVLNHNPMRLGSEEAFMLVNLDSTDKETQIMEKLESYAIEHYPELRISIEPTKYGPPVAAPVAVRVSGKNQQEIASYVTKIKEHIGKVPGTKNIRDDWGDESKKLIAKVNQPRALRAGVTNRDVAISLQTMLSGFETTQYRENDEIIPVTLRSENSDRENLDKLESLNIYSQVSKATVPLKQVADLQLVWEPNNILRRNRLRTVTVMADVEPGYNPQKIANQIKPSLDAEKDTWSDGYFYEFGGEKESSETSSQSIVKEIPLAALLILLLLVGQFNSFRQALIIILTIPMGVIGVVIGLILTGSYMGFMTFLGIVSLSGIVINDAIVLIERINLEWKNGLSPQEAILEAAQSRMRPILLTTYTTIGGMLPLWLSGSAMFQPMAIAIIFGLLFATFLTLGFVPILYAIMYRVKY